MDQGLLDENKRIQITEIAENFFEDVQEFTYIFRALKDEVRLIETLDDMGHRVSVGVMNQGSDDAEFCAYLDIPQIEIPAFQTVSEQDQERNLQIMQDADVVIVADIPFGTGNIRNLDGLENIKGKLYIHENIVNRDFTGGRLKERLDEIQKRKEVHFYRDSQCFFFHS